MTHCRKRRSKWNDLFKSSNRKIWTWYWLVNTKASAVHKGRFGSIFEASRVSTRHNPQDTTLRSMVVEYRCPLQEVQRCEWTIPSSTIFVFPHESSCNPGLAFWEALFVLYLSGGKIIETPNVIQTMVNQRVIDQYQQYYLETNFKPFSASTMQRILVLCSTTVRKSLQGLDYLSAKGTKELEDLATIAESLTNHGSDNPTTKRLEKYSRKASNISKRL